MQKSFQFQYQPIIQLHPKRFVIDKPSLFASPDGDNCNALSRYHLDFELKSVSDVPAIDDVVSAALIATSNSSKENIRTIGCHFPVITKDTAVDGNMMFVPDKPFVTFFDALTDRDASKIPTIVITVLYKNLMGGCFLVNQAFYIFMNTEDRNLQNWQIAITSFPTTFKSKLHSLENLDKEPSKWHKFFDQLKSDYVEGIEGPDEIELLVLPIPGAYVANYITELEYDEMTAKVGFPRLTFAHTKCIKTQDAE